MKRLLFFFIFLPQVVAFSQSRDFNYERPNSYMPSTKYAKVEEPRLYPIKYYINNDLPLPEGTQYNIFKQRNSVDYYDAGSYWAERVHKYSLDRLTDAELKTIKVRKKGSNAMTDLYDYIVNSSPERIQSLFGSPTAVFTETGEESGDTYSDYAHGPNLESVSSQRVENPGVFYRYITEPFNSNTKRRIDNFARRSPIYKYMHLIWWYETDALYLEIPNSLMYNTVPVLLRSGRKVIQNLETPLMQEEQGLGVTTVKCGDDPSVLSKLFPMSSRPANRSNRNPASPNYTISVTTDIYSAYNIGGDFEFGEQDYGFLDPYRFYVRDGNIVSFYYVNIEFGIEGGKIAQVTISYSREYYEP